MRRIALLAVLALLACDVIVADGGPPPPPPPPSAEEEEEDDTALEMPADSDGSAMRHSSSRLPSLSSFMPHGLPTVSWLKLSGVGGLRVGVLSAATQVLTTVRPYATNPMRLLRLPSHIKLFLALSLISLFSLLNFVLGVFAVVTNPAGAVMRLCTGSACFHGALLALRRERQVQRLLSHERLPYTLCTFVTMLAALSAALDKKRLSSYVFGLLHLIAFGSDALHMLCRTHTHAHRAPRKGAPGGRRTVRSGA